MRGYAKLFLAATVAALACRLFLIEDYRIVSESMAPGLLGGDLVFVSKFDFNLRLPFSSYELVRFRAPRRGEIVAFTLPDRGLQTFVKRVVALGGDKVRIEKGVLEVNGVAESATIPVRWNRATAKDFGPVEVPAGHFFVLGDNRDESVDSRSWGPVPHSCLKGRVALVWLSLDSEGKFRGGRTGLRPNVLAGRE